MLGLILNVNGLGGYILLLDKINYYGNYFSLLYVNVVFFGYNELYIKFWKRII